MRARSFAIVFACTAALVACGGQISATAVADDGDATPPPIDTSVPDSTPIVDASPPIDSTPPPIDTSPPPPDTAPPPPDTTPPPVDTGPGCLASEPVDGTDCTGALSCAYASPCPVTARCVGGSWFVPKCKACPDGEPGSGSSCSLEGLACDWNTACGGVDRGVCSGGAWSIAVGVCPPPTAGCPATDPVDGTPCTPTSETCLYDNGCGAVGVARCTPTGWQSSVYPCKEDCPVAAPAINSPCVTPPSGTCGYTFGPTCSFSCLCWSGQWTCYGTPCTDPPTGSGLDGGT